MQASLRVKSACRQDLAGEPPVRQVLEAAQLESLMQELLQVCSLIDVSLTADLCASPFEMMGDCTFNTIYDPDQKRT